MDLKECPSCGAVAGSHIDVCKFCGSPLADGATVPAPGSTGAGGTATGDPDAVVRPFIGGTPKRPPVNWIPIAKWAVYIIALLLAAGAAFHQTSAATQPKSQPPISDPSGTGHGPVLDAAR